MATLEEITQICKNEDYLDDPNCVYSYTFTNCMNKWKWIIIMQKQPNVIFTQYYDKIVDSNYALYAADELKVLQIIDIENLSNRPINMINRSITDSCSYGSDEIEYERNYIVGEIIRSKFFDENCDDKKSDNIYYFNTLQPTYASVFDPQKYNYTGKWYKWHHDGSKLSECNYKNGKLNGEYVEFYNNGNIMTQSNYNNISNAKIGLWKEWHENGNIMTKTYYSNNGFKIGMHTHCYENVNIKMEEYYNNILNSGKKQNGIKIQI